MLAALYIAQVFAVAFVLVIYAALFPRLTGLSFDARILLGLTLTPAVLGVLTLLIAVVWPGAPRPIFFLLPLALSCIAMLAVRDRIRVVVIRLKKTCLPPRLSDPTSWAYWTSACASLVFVAAAIFASLGEIVGHDALVYMSEARVFAQARTIMAIPGFEAAIGQVVKTHPHLFLWQAFLAQALMATDGSLGYGHDFLARLAAQSTAALIPASTLALARVATPAIMYKVAPALLLAFGYVEYISPNYDIDAFRIITFLAFVALVIPAVVAHGSLSTGRLGVIGTVCGFAAAAHTVDIALVGLVLCALSVLALIRRSRWRNVIQIYVGCTPILALIAVPYIHNWTVYGTILGRGMNFLSYPGTPLWTAFEHRLHWTKATNPLQALAEFAWQYRTVPLIIATACGVGSWIGMKKNPPMRKTGALGVIFFVILVGPLLMSGGAVSLQGAMLSNYRYGLVACALGAPLIAAFSAFLLKRTGSISAHWLRAIHIVKLAGFILVFAAGSWSLVLSIGVSVHSREYLKENELFVAAAVKGLPPDANWITDRYTPTYFVARPPLLLYSSAAHPLLAARTQDEVLDFLRRNRIRMFAMHEKAPDWWPKMELYQVIERLPGTRRASTRKWTLFFLPPVGPQRHETAPTNL